MKRSVATFLVAMLLTISVNGEDIRKYIIIATELRIANSNNSEISYLVTFYQLIIAI